MQKEYRQLALPEANGRVNVSSLLALRDGWSNLSSRAGDTIALALARTKHVRQPALLIHDEAVV
jgi:hypothetical protein